jgi:hypothetical protein
MLRCAGSFKQTTKELFMRTLSGTLAVAAAVVATIAFIPQQASAERVCRQECVGPVCQERCVESSDRDRDQIRTDGRGERREENRREDRRDERREPGVEFKVPGVGVEIR